jgi:hypothetical protein
VYQLSLCFNWAPRHEGVLLSGRIVLRILDFDSRWRWVVSFTPRPLKPQGKSSWYPLDRRLRGPQSHSGRGGEEKNCQPLPGLENPDHPARRPALYRWAIPAPECISLISIKCRRNACIHSSYLFASVCSNIEQWFQDQVNLSFICTTLALRFSSDTRVISRLHYIPPEPEYFSRYSDSATDWMTGVRYPAKAGKFFSSSPRPDRLWGPPNLLSSGYRG